MQQESVGRYELLASVGARTRHTTYVARMTGAPGFERLVALELRAGDDKTTAAFLASARLLASLHHQHVAHVLDAGTIGDHAFVARELVHGRTARHVWQRAIERETRLPFDFALTVALAVAAALQHARSRHGAVTVALEDIVIGFDGAVKLLAVGLDGPPDADVRSLGDILHELATMAPLADPLQLAPTFPPRLGQILRRAMPGSADRWADAGAMRDAMVAVARRMELVLGDAAVCEVMTQLFGDVPDPSFEVPVRASVPPTDPKPRRGAVRSATEILDALLAEQDKRPAAKPPASQRSDFDSGAVTAISDVPEPPVAQRGKTESDNKHPEDSTEPQPKIEPDDSIEVSVIRVAESSDAQPAADSSDLPPLPTQVAAVPPPPPPSHASLLNASLGPGELDPRLAPTLPPTDRSVLGLPPVQIPAAAQPVSLPPARPRRAAPAETTAWYRHPTLFVGVAAGILFGVLVAILILVLQDREPAAVVQADAAPVSIDAAIPDAPIDAVAIDAPPDAPTRIHLRIASTPVGATVLLDNRRLGKTPLDELVDPAPGKHQLKLRYSGFNTIRVEIDLDADVERTFPLVPAAPPPDAAPPLDPPSPEPDSDPT